jgi:hypothetical protein
VAGVTAPPHTHTPIPHTPFLLHTKVQDEQPRHHNADTGVRDAKPGQGSKGHLVQYVHLHKLHHLHHHQHEHRGTHQYRRQALHNIPAHQYTAQPRTAGETPPHHTTTHHTTPRHATAPKTSEALNFPRPSCRPRQEST